MRRSDAPVPECLVQVLHGARLVSNVSSTGQRAGDTAFSGRTRALFCFGHGCSGYRMPLQHERINALSPGCYAYFMPLEHERNYVLGMDTLVTGTRTLFCFGHGCRGHCMLLECERYSVLSMDTLQTVYTLLKRERYQSYVLESIRLVLLKHEHSCMRNHRNVFNRMASYRRHFHKYDSISSLASAPLRAS